MDKKLYYGGPILTMDPDNPTAQALLIEDGRILAAGTMEALSSQAADASWIDLQGHTLMPAFIDGHSHMGSAGLFMQQCSLVGCRSFGEILQRIRDFREKKNLTHGEIIYCIGYDTAILKERTHPTGTLLDTLNLDNPIACMHQSLHMGAFNKAALAYCGVDENYTGDPGGGFIGRDENGKLNGYFEESAVNPLPRILNAFDPVKFRQAILDAQEDYLRRGITTIQDGSSNKAEQLAVYEELAAEGKLVADVVVYIDYDPADPDFWGNTLARLGNREYHNHLKIGGIKMFLDGSPQGRTAWMRKPYEGDNEYYGYPVLTDAKVRQVLVNAIEAGLQPLAHCNGDAASEQFLSGWEYAVSKTGRGTELRPVMIHSQLVGDDQLERMGKVGMMPSFFVGHCYFWGDTHMKNFGERGKRISPVGSAIRMGLPYSFHQDTPVTPPDMLHSIWCAVNRVTRTGAQLDPSQRISPQEALAGVTSGCAYSYFEERTKGILRPGAVADLVILEQDPTAADPMDIWKINVLSTIKDGKTVHSRT